MCSRPKRYSQVTATRHKQGGYVLVLMLIVVVVGSLYGLLDRLNANAAETERNVKTEQALRQAREALLAYSATIVDLDKNYIGYAYGYLPCPDMAYDDPPPRNMLGTGAGSCSQTQWSIGLFPYRSLGLSELRDGDGNCLWYAVSGTHIPVSASAPTPSSGKLQVINASGVTLANGVAAVIISPGSAIGQQNRTSLNNPCGTDSGQLAEFIESTGASFTNGITTSAIGTTVKNDRLQWLTAAEIFTPAYKRTQTKYSGAHD